MIEALAGGGRQQRCRSARRHERPRTSEDHVLWCHAAPPARTPRAETRKTKGRAVGRGTELANRLADARASVCVVGNMTQHDHTEAGQPRTRPQQRNPSQVGPSPAPDVQHARGRTARAAPRPRLSEKICRASSSDAPGATQGGCRRKPASPAGNFVQASNRPEPISVAATKKRRA